MVFWLDNYPLQGGKYSTLEGMASVLAVTDLHLHNEVMVMLGGVRVNAFASGGYLPEAVRGTKQEEIVHVADW